MVVACAHLTGGRADDVALVVGEDEGVVVALDGHEARCPGGTLGGRDLEGGRSMVGVDVHQALAERVTVVDVVVLCVWPIEHSVVGYGDGDGLVHVGEDRLVECPGLHQQREFEVFSLDVQVDAVGVSSEQVLSVGQRGRTCDLVAPAENLFARGVVGPECDALRHHGDGGVLHVGVSTAEVGSDLWDDKHPTVVRQQVSGVLGHAGMGVPVVGEVVVVDVDIDSGVEVAREVEGEPVAFGATDARLVDPLWREVLGVVQHEGALPVLVAYRDALDEESRLIARFLILPSVGHGADGVAAVVLGGGDVELQTGQGVAHLEIDVAVGVFGDVGVGEGHATVVGAPEQVVLVGERGGGVVVDGGVIDTVVHVAGELHLVAVHTV